MSKNELSKILVFPQEWSELATLDTEVIHPKDPFLFYNASPHSAEYLASLSGPVDREFILSDWE